MAATRPITVPEVGESIYEVHIVQWLKQEGETVGKDENLVEMETDKATVDLPAPVAGRLTQILKQADDTAAVGEVIGYIEEGAAADPPPARAASTDAGAEPPRRSRREPPPVAAVPVEAVEPLPPKRAPAPKPRRTPPVVSAGSAPAPGARPEEIVPMSPIRRRIAARLVEAQQTAALVTTFNEIDMSAVIKLREEYRAAFQEQYDARLGFMSFFVKAVVEGLKLVPELNAEVRGTDIVYRHYYDIGIAIGGGRVLVVPVLRNAQRMSFADIERAIADFAARARDNKLNPEDLEGGTFTITNGGIYGSLLSTPMVNPPQSGILGMHTIADRPVARDGQVVIRPMMYVALTYDHRLIDGREAVGFLRRVKEIIEEPARLLLEV